MLKQLEVPLGFTSVGYKNNNISSEGVTLWKADPENKLQHLLEKVVMDIGKKSQSISCKKSKYFLLIIEKNDAGRIKDVRIKQI